MGPAGAWSQVSSRAVDGGLVAAGPRTEMEQLVPPPQPFFPAALLVPTGIRWPSDDAPLCLPAG